MYWTLKLKPLMVYAKVLYLQDLVDQQMRDNKEKPVMQLVMGGKFAQQIICRSVAYRSEKEEDFYQVRCLSAVRINQSRLSFADAEQQFSYSEYEQRLHCKAHIPCRGVALPQASFSRD